MAPPCNLVLGPEAGGGVTSGADKAATSTDSTTPAPGTGGSSSSNDSDQPPAPGPTDPGTAPDPGTPKPVCAAESLDNDELRNADAFDSCIAGTLTEDVYKMFVNGFTATFKLEPAGGTIGDRDWQLEVTFQSPH